MFLKVVKPALLFFLLVVVTLLVSYTTSTYSFSSLRWYAKRAIRHIEWMSHATLANAIEGQVQFEKVMLPTTAGKHSSLTIGPDGKLYAITLDGLIKRFAIHFDGTLGEPEIIYTLQDMSGTRVPRLSIGFAFDPAATADSLIAWVTHSSYTFDEGPDWDGKLTRLKGAKLQEAHDVLVHLPRSASDHLSNSIAFGPDGALYFMQGSNTAMGAPDKNWGFRPEHLLSAAVLRLDLSNYTSPLPIDVKTSDGGTYNPYAANAPLTIYASGIRNGYDLLWHSNGELYVPDNGSSSGGNAPASVPGSLRPDGSRYSGPEIPALHNILQDQKDYMYRVQKGGYYGHPNPARGEYVLHGGNPTSHKDSVEMDLYPVGTLPDSNWRGISFEFSAHNSPNGLIEYRSNAFNGKLKGKILVARLVYNRDILVLEPGGSNNDIIKETSGSNIPGFGDFLMPLDLVEDLNTGNIYVAEFGGSTGRITLLRPLSTNTNGGRLATRYKGLQNFLFVN